MNRTLGVFVPTPHRPGTASLADPQPLGLLALRRVQVRVRAATVPAGENGSNGHAADPTVVAGGGRGALGRLVGREIGRTWTTLDLLLAQVAVATRLGRGGPER